VFWLTKIQNSINDSGNLSMKIISIVLLILNILIFNCKPKSKSSTSTSIPTVVYYQKTGDVKISSASGSPLAIKLFDIIPDGSILQTGANGQVELLLPTGALLKLFENTNLKIDTKLFADQNLTRNRFFLNSGKLFVKQPSALKKGESIEVVTTTQVAGVRGTEFMTVVESDSSKVLVSEGSVQSEQVTEANENDPLLSDSAAVIEEGNKSEANDDSRETLPLTEEEKELLAKESKSAAELILEAKEQMQSIREQFEQERERIRANLEEFKVENRQKLEDQKSNNQNELEAQKTKNAELLNSAKGDKEQGTREMNSAKETQKSDIQNKAKSELDAIKEGLKK